MVDKRSHEQLDNLRERLYARGETPREHRRVNLQREPTKSTTGSSDIVRPPLVPPPPKPPVPVEPRAEAFSDEGEYQKPRNYRAILVIIGLAFFVLSIALSSLYLVLGRNTVSGSNIALNVSGPFTLGGGDVMTLQVGIANENSVPIESATLIVDYPPGTRSAEGEGEELFSERIPLDAGIGAGESRNIQLKSRVFGEENQEAEAKVSIEYRVAGSSATFFKEAVPHRFKISHAPIVLKIQAEKAISSGEETTIKLTITSNSSSPISNLLIKAEYPSGFDYSSSNPSPVSGRNVWRVNELKPEESTTIEITGVIMGTKSEKYVMKFASGVAGERNPNDLASVLAVGDTEFTLEDPFLAVDVKIDGKNDEVVSVAPGAQAAVSIEIKNTLDTPVYDGSVEVKLSGNALSDTDVNAGTGYYDANTRTIRFDTSSRINQGSTERFAFSLRPSTNGLETPQVSFTVSASARRVSQSSAREQIASTNMRTIKVESRPTLVVELNRASSGPVPPVAGQTTTYEVLWRVVNSANSISGAIATAVLPSFVEWSNDTTGSGAWSYNSSTRTVEWRAGNINAGSETSGTFKVKFLPSSSLIGRTPTIVEAAYLRSNDNFTGSLLRYSANAVTTELNGKRESGTVQAN